MFQICFQLQSDLYILHRTVILHLITYLKQLFALLTVKKKSKLRNLVNCIDVRSRKVLTLYKSSCYIRNYGEWYSSLAYTLSSRDSLFKHAFLQYILQMYMNIQEHGQFITNMNCQYVWFIKQTYRTKLNNLQKSRETYNCFNSLTGSQTMWCLFEVGTSMLELLLVFNSSTEDTNLKLLQY